MPLTSVTAPEENGPWAFALLAGCRCAALGFCVAGGGGGGPRVLVVPDGPPPWRAGSPLNAKRRCLSLCKMHPSPATALANLRGDLLNRITAIVIITVIRLRLRGRRV